MSRNDGLADRCRLRNVPASINGHVCDLLQTFRFPCSLRLRVRRSLTLRSSRRFSLRRLSSAWHASTFSVGGVGIWKR